LATHSTQRGKAATQTAVGILTQRPPRLSQRNAEGSRNKLNSLSSIGWRRGPERGGTFVFQPPLPMNPQRFGTDKDGETTGKTSLSAPNLWVFPLSGSGFQGANRASGNSLLGPLPTPASWGEEENTLRNFFATCEQFRLLQCKGREGWRRGTPRRIFALRPLRKKPSRPLRLNRARAGLVAAALQQCAPNGSRSCGPPG